MRRLFLVCLPLLCLAAPTGAAAQTSDFEALVEDALGHESSGGEPPASAVPPRLLLRPSPDAPPLPEPVLREHPAPDLGEPAALDRAPAPVIREAQPLEPSVSPSLEPPTGPKPYVPPIRRAASPVPDGDEGTSEAGAGEPAHETSGASAQGQPVEGSAAEAPAAPAAPGAAGRSLASLDVGEVNAATYQENAGAIKGPSPLVLKAQILLDLAGASPGVIDGIYGGNVAKSIAAVETVLGLPADGQLDREVWDALGGDQAPDVLVPYTITQEDVSYPFLPSIPGDYAEQAALPSLGFTSPQEMLGERFHMDVELLQALNPGVDFREAGTTIIVAAVEGQPVTGKISRIEADKARRQVRAYDAQNRLIVAYPATIGSLQTPSPSGTHTVNALAPNPVYYYNPANFVQGDNLEKLELPPGPNNPVGTMWIDLSEPGYGIHGTPEPSRIDKTNSNGCVRLTNWDAEELATLVEPGVIVSFIE